MKHSLSLIAGALILATLTGCSSVKTFDYGATTAEATASAPAPVAKSIAVMPFFDMRSAFNPQQIPDPALADRADDFPPEDAYAYGLGFLPLVHGGFVDRRCPELSEDYISIGRFQWDPVNDLANAAIVSLKASNMFTRVVKANSLQQANTDYIFRGSIINTAYTGTAFTYGITYFGSWVLWLIGAPYGKSVNCLWVRFELVDRKTGNTLWSQNYLERDYMLQWIYARLGLDVSMYPELMKRAMNKAIGELHTFLTMNQ